MVSMVPDIRRVVGLLVSDWSIEHNERSFGFAGRSVEVVSQSEGRCSCSLYREGHRNRPGGQLVDSCKNKRYMIKLLDESSGGQD